MNKRIKRPIDPSQLANLIMKIATGEVEDVAPEDGKNPAVAARAKKLSAEERSEIAKKAAKEG